MSRSKLLFFSAITIIAFFLILEFGTKAFNALFPEELLQKPGTEALAFMPQDLTPFSFFGYLPSLELRPNDNFFYEFDQKKVFSKKEPDEFRIFIIGGSVAKGYGASKLEKKYYRILEKKLNNEKPDHIKKVFNIISAGRLGYVSGQELALLINGILDFKPDMTIHLNGANDIMTVSNYNESPGYPFYFQSLKKALMATQLEKKIEEKVEEFVFLKDLKKMLKKYKTSTPRLTVKNIARHYERNMKTTAQILQANQIPAFFFLQPLLVFKTNQSAIEKKYFKTIRDQANQFWISSFPMMAKSLESISKNTGINWGDLKASLNDEGKTIFTDSVHLTDFGQARLADVIFNQIKAELYKR